MSYSVTKQYGRGQETTCGNYRTIPEAKAFIDKNIVNDMLMGTPVTYRIKDFDEVIQEFDSTKIKSTQNESTTGSQGQSRGSSFSPTPLATSPRPAGMPQTSKPNKDDNKKDE